MAPSTRAPSTYAFAPERYEEQLAALIGELDELADVDGEGYRQALRRHPKDGRGFFSKSEIIRGFRHLNEALAWGRDEDRLRRPAADEAGAHRQRGGAGDPAHPAPPVPGPLHLLPLRRAHAQELSLRRARRATRGAAPLRPLRPDAVAAALLPPHRPPGGQDRADRARRHLVVLPRGVPALVRQALVRRAERLRALARRRHRTAGRHGTAVGGARRADRRRGGSDRTYNRIVSDHADRQPAAARDSRGDRHLGRSSPPPSGPTRPPPRAASAWWWRPGRTT